MGESLVISETLYGNLVAAEQQRGLASVEQLLEEWQASEADLYRRCEEVQRIDALREGLRGG